MHRGLCRLCGRDADLLLSHILPAFAFRWLRESAGGGHLRNSETPNQRVQDGTKEYWLCASCESLFGRSEKAFADRLFYPFLSNPKQTLPYSNWLLHFCTSVSWRVLRLSIDEVHLHKWDVELLSRAKAAEVVWRSYLLREKANPGAFEQHLLPLGQIASTSASLPPNFNRYIMRAIQMDVCHSKTSAFTFAKLGRFAVLGFIHESNQSRWRGTKVNANEGTIQPLKYVLPSAFGTYLMEKARDVSTALHSVSDKQSARIEKAFRSNAENFVGTDAHAAMEADIRLFGDDAFAPPRPKPTSSEP